MIDDLKLKVFITNYEDSVLELEHRIDDFVKQYNVIVKKYSYKNYYIKPLLHEFYSLSDVYSGVIIYNWSAGSGYSSDDGTDAIQTNWLFSDTWKQELIDELQPKYNKVKEENKLERDKKILANEKKKKEQYLKLKAEYGD